ncbi:MAG: ArgE/DapE family deacylase [Synergistales bacterium]|nr:ArgE/DapE family deacylase [Synergistales bacterium]
MASSRFNIDPSRTLQDLQDLIRINSVNPELETGAPGETDISIFLASVLEELGMKVKISDLGNNRVNVTGILRGSGGGKTLLLNGHSDTVDTLNMEIDPFDPVVREGKVYGRGSLDMKGGISSILAALRAVVKEKCPLKGDVVAAFVADEEYRSIGTEALVKEISADGAIICEPTALGLILAHKGFTWNRIVFHGKAAHGSRPEEGIDAIAKAGGFLSRMDEFEKQVLSKRTHPLLGRASIHAALISGGTGISTYPGKCVLQLERRTLPGETPEKVREEIDHILEDLSKEDRFFKADHEQYFWRSPLEIREDLPLVRCLEKAFYETLGETPRICGFSGWADSALMNDAGIPAVNFGPSGLGLHGSVEYVDLRSVLICAEVIATTIADFCGDELPGP